MILALTNRSSCRIRRMGGACLALFSLPLVSNCGGGSAAPVQNANGLIQPGLTPFNNSRQATAAVCQANPHTNGRARWTVLMFINAASNLQDDSWLNVGQMASVGSDSNVNIVVQWKQASSNPFFSQAGIQPSPGDTPSFVGTRRYLIRQHSSSDVQRIESGDTTPLDPDRLADPATNVIKVTDPQGTSDMGDWHVLRDFVQWGATNYPADHLAVLIWDHGSAALSVLDNRSVRVTSQLKRRAHSRSVSFDTNTGSQITTQQIAQALATLGTGSLQRADMLIIDCSLEGTAEVAYEVRNAARTLVASEESPPGEGLAYADWLAALKTSGKNPCDLGGSILSTFINQSIYQDNVHQSQLTLSLTDLTQMQAVANALDTFASSLKTHVVDSATQIATARDNTQQFEFSDYKDLYDFADRIRTASAPADLKNAATNLELALVSTSTGGTLASVHGHDSSNTHARATGLSIHFPLPGQLESEYDTLAISKSGAAPNWDQFLRLVTR